MAYDREAIESERRRNKLYCDWYDAVITPIEAADKITHPYSYDLPKTTIDRLWNEHIAQQKERHDNGEDIGPFIEIINFKFNLT